MAATTLLHTLTAALDLDSDPSSLLHPDTPDYKTANGSYFSAFENELQPSYIAQPTTPQQVQKLITALRPHVVAGDCTLAVRGEGHTPFAGSANVQGGVTVDLRRLKGVKVLEDGDKEPLVEIAAGESWTTVYAELDKHGLTVGGGRVGRIGVMGFLLGGGLSMFSSRRGFACDSIVEFKVVLGSGELVRASADENADLWVSLKGGLNNFGIVTSVTMKTLPAKDVWGGVTYYMPGTFSEVLRHACDFAHNETDEDTHIMCSAGYGYGHQAVTSVMYHTGGVANPPALQRFTAVQPQIEQMNTMRTATHPEFCDELSRFSSNGMRQFWASITIKPDITLIEAMHDKWQATLATIQDADGLTFSFGFHPLTRALLAHSAAAGGNAMDIPASDGPLFVVLINPCWTQPQDDTRIFAAIEALVADFRRLASEKGLLHRYIFTNYAYHKDDVMAGYGEKSLARMRAVSKKYDPEGLFQKGVPGGFKLSI